MESQEDLDFAAVQARWRSSFERLSTRHETGGSNLMNFSLAWDMAREFLRPRDIRTAEPKKQNIDTVKQAFQILNNGKFLTIILEVFVDDMRKQEYLITEEVNKYMTLYHANEDIAVVRNLIDNLADWWKAWLPIPELGYTIVKTFNLEFQTHLFSILPPSFPSAFKRLCLSTVTSPPDEALWNNFELLGFLDRYEYIIASVCYEQIDTQVHEAAAKNWSEPMLTSLRSWMADKIVPWMILPYARGAKSQEETRNMLQGIGSRFDFHLCKTLCDLRTSEIFDIIIDYPDSNAALVDLKECLLRVDQRAQLVRTLRTQNRKRLLHPGADTKNILEQYVSTIRCLRIIDPPGVLLFKVADPVRRYLRERPDTIRTIVSSLVGEGGDLVDENEPIQPLQVHIDDYTDPNWEPEAIDAGPEFRTSKPSDVISTLVSIYDSKDLFVKEVQVLLAQRLLAVADDNFENERRNVEILKIRFGDAALQVCEVMLRDMTDSRRINQHIQAQIPSKVQSTIISKHFWPALLSSKLVMPGQFKSIQQEYNKEFTTFKPDKRLRWLPQLGSVQLELELEDRKLDIQVSSLEAAIVELFSTQSHWAITDLAQTLGGVDETSVLKGLHTWMDHGVVKAEQNNIYVLLETAEESSQSRLAPARPVQEPESSIMSVQQQEAEQIRVHWKFIEGMLTNLGALSLDRIQTMLKFVPNYSRTIDELGAFMDSARREGLVTLNNGLWKLNK